MDIPTAIRTLCGTQGCKDPRYTVAAQERCHNKTLLPIWQSRFGTELWGLLIENTKRWPQSTPGLAWRNPISWRGKFLAIPAHSDRFGPGYLMVSVFHVAFVKEFSVKSCLCCNTDVQELEPASVHLLGAVAIAPEAHQGQRCVVVTSVTNGEPCRDVYACIGGSSPSADPAAAFALLCQEQGRVLRQFWPPNPSVPGEGAANAAFISLYHLVQLLEASEPAAAQKILPLFRDSAEKWTRLYDRNSAQPLSMVELPVELPAHYPLSRLSNSFQRYTGPLTVQVQLLQVSAAANPLLSRLSLAADALSDFPAAQRFIAACTSLTSLALENGSVSAADLSSLLMPTVLPRGLSELFLRSCSISDEALDVVSAFVVASPLLLRAMSLDGNVDTFTDDALERLAGALILRGVPLEHFSMIGCRRSLRPRVLTALAPVRDVWLTGNVIPPTADSCSILATFRGRLVCSLQDMPYSVQSYSVQHDTLAAFLSSAASPNDPPSTLTVSNGSVEWARLQGCAANSRRMVDVQVVSWDNLPPQADESRLNVLCVSGISVTTNMPTQAISLLRASPNARFFIWTGAALTAVVPALAPLLRQTISSHATLVHLDLSANNLLDAGAEALAASLRVNRTIRTVNFDDNKTTEVGWKALRGIFYGNKKVVVLDIAHDRANRLRVLQQQMEQHSKAEWNYRLRMKHCYKMRNPSAAQAECRKMVMAKGLLRVAKKVKEAAEETLRCIDQALAFNNEAAKPKFVREHERARARELKLAQAWEQAQAKWTHHLEKQHDAAIKNEASRQNAEKKKQQKEAAQAVARPKPVRHDLAANLPLVPLGEVIVPLGAPWYKSRPPRHQQQRPAINVMQRRVDAVIDHCMAAGDIARHTVLLSDVVPALEAAYRSRHAAYVHALRQVAGFPMAPGWTSAADQLGTPCYVHTVTSAATYADPRLEREVASYFSKKSDVGEPLYAVFLPQQCKQLTSEQLYCYNLYLAFYFQAFAFPLPSSRRNFLFNIPRLGLEEEQAPVVPVKQATNALLATPPNAVLDPAIFFALHGLTRDMHDAINACDLAYCEEQWCVRKFWLSPQSAPQHALSDMSSTVLGVRAFADEPRLRALVAMQCVLREMQFGWLEQGDSAYSFTGSGGGDDGAVTDAVLLSRASTSLTESCAGDEPCCGTVGAFMPLDLYAGAAMNSSTGWRPRASKQAAPLELLLPEGPQDHSVQQCDTLSADGTDSDTLSGGAPSALSHGNEGSRDDPAALERDILVRTFRTGPASLYPQITALRNKCVVAGLLPSFTPAEDGDAGTFAVVTQCSYDRLARLERLGKSLRLVLPTRSGAIPVHFAAAVYISNLLGEESASRQMLATLQKLASELVACGHVVSCTFLVVFERDVKNGLAQGYYPINMLRNLATDYSRDVLRGRCGLLIDVDFAVGPSLFDPQWSFFCRQQGDELMQRLMTQGSKLAVVLPALEANAAPPPCDLSVNATLQSVCDAVDRSDYVPFHIAHYWKGHGPSNTEEWVRLTRLAACAGEEVAAYEASFIEGYEPYIIVPLQAIPKYDARFVGYGFNKVQHALHLHALGFKFLVTPMLYVHCAPHERNYSWERTFANTCDKYDPVQRYWLQGLFERFRAEISPAGLVK